VSLTFTPILVFSWAFTFLYKLQGVSGEKNNIVVRVIFRSLCRRIGNIHMNVCVILDENLDTSDSEVYQPRFV